MSSQTPHLDALVCAFGEPWLGPHPLCRAQTARVCGVPIAEVPLPDLSRYAVPAVEPVQANLFQVTA